jgi:hypothetical protein
LSINNCLKCDYFFRLKLNANRWWFHLYTIIKCYVTEKSIDNNDINLLIDGNVDECKGPMKSSDFTTAMKQFIEKSPLVEFHKRLELLFIFHCHAVHMGSSKRTGMSRVMDLSLFH